MPCFLRQKISVDFSQMDIELFKQAMTAAGYVFCTVTGEIYYIGARGRHADGSPVGGWSLKDGKLYVHPSEQETLIPAIRKAYATEVVKTVVKKRGWHMQETAQENVFLVKKGGR